MEEVLAWVSEESIDYHSRRNHFSNWLYARGEFELAARAPAAVGHQLGLERVDEALGHRVVVGVADRSDRGPSARNGAHENGGRGLGPDRRSRLRS